MNLKQMRKEKERPYCLTLSTCIYRQRWIIFVEIE